MKNVKHFSIFALACLLAIILFAACLGGNGTANKNTSVDTTAKTTISKMTAKERLAKNSILEKRTKWTDLHLVGKVKTFSETDYELSGNGNKVMDQKKVDSFDVTGKVIVWSYSDKTNGKITESKYLIKYDANDNDTAGYLCKPDGKMVLSAMNRYDSSGYEMTLISYRPDGKITYRLVSKRDEVVVIDYWPDGKEQDKRIYKFDGKDNLIEMNLGPNSPWPKTVYKYDEKGMATEIGVFYSNGKLHSKNIRKYDDKGNKRYSIFYKADETIDETDSFKYDNKSNEIEHAYYKTDGNFKSKYIRKYDDKGHETEMIVYKKDGNIDDELSKYYDREYDATGNITRLTTFKMKAGKKVATRITESSYTYY